MSGDAERTDLWLGDAGSTTFLPLGNVCSFDTKRFSRLHFGSGSNNCQAVQRGTPRQSDHDQVLVVKGEPS